MKKVRKMLIYFVYRTGQEKGLVNWQKYRALCKYVNWETVMKKRKSVEKIAAVLLMAGYIGITGGYGNFEAVDIVVKAENLEKENEESQDMEEMLSQTDSIELTDEIAGFYSTDFSCMLSEEEVGLLKDIMPEQQEITTANKRSTYYQIIFRNKKGEILRLAPMIDHEFSTYFMFPDNSAQHMYWYCEFINVRNNLKNGLTILKKKTIFPMLLYMTVCQEKTTAHCLNVQNPEPFQK